MSTTLEHPNSVLAETERRKNPFTYLPGFLVVFEILCNGFRFFDAFPFTSATDLLKENARECILIERKIFSRRSLFRALLEIIRALSPTKRV